MDGTGDLFAPFVDALGPGAAVTVVRYPRDQSLGYDALEAHARAALPTRGPFVLLGESFSGPIAIRLAASQPAGLAGLVLCCTFARNPWPAFSALSPLVGLLPMAHTPMAVLGPALLGRDSSPPLRSALRAAMAQVSSASLRARLRAILSMDASLLLRDTRLPTLDLRGARDRLVPASAARLVRLLRPDAQVVDIDGPHGLLQTRPHEAARAIGAFMHGLRMDGGAGAESP